MKIVESTNKIKVNEKVCEELKERLRNSYHKEFELLVDKLQTKVGTKQYGDKYCADFKKCCSSPLKQVFANIDANIEMMCTSHGIGYHDAMEDIIEFMFDRLQEAKEAQVTLDAFNDTEVVGLC